MKHFEFLIKITIELSSYRSSIFHYKTIKPSKISIFSAPAHLRIAKTSSSSSQKPMLLNLMLSRISNGKPFPISPHLSCTDIAGGIMTPGRPRLENFYKDSLGITNPMGNIEVISSFPLITVHPVVDTSPISCDHFKLRSNGRPTKLAKMGYFHLTFGPNEGYITQNDSFIIESIVYLKNQWFKIVKNLIILK